LKRLRWADEIVVVVDASSRDQTLAIARELADRVVVRRFDDFASQRNAGRLAARGAWVLAVDADERVTEELGAEIRQVIATSEAGVSGYRIPIRSVVLGREFVGSGTQKDNPLRLFRRTEGAWVGTVHETVRVPGEVGQLRNHLRHKTIPNLHVFLRKMNKYTTLEAVGMYRGGERFRYRDVFLRPIWTFLRLYGWHQGYRDGWEGLVFCGMSGVSVGVRHLKLRELERSGGRGLAGGRASGRREAA
jgi:glycosyltransferase involved in cell wall biosynthesis